MSKISKLIIALGLSLPVIASAASTPWIVKGGVSVVAPTTDDFAGAKTDVSNELNVTPSIEYVFADTPVSVEVLLGLPFKHDVKQGGAKIATFKHLPPTITAKLNQPLGNSGLTAYVGVGVNATLVWDAKTTDGTKLDTSDSIGVAGQVGARYDLPNQPWGVYADVRYAEIDSKVKVKNGPTLDTLEVNPWVYTVGVSYRF